VSRYGADAREIVICTYGRERGAIYSLGRTWPALFGQRCKWVTYPKECRDLAGANERYGSGRAYRNHQARQLAAIAEIYSMAETAGAAQNPAFDTGIVRPEGAFSGFAAGDLCVVSGTPGRRQTSFVQRSDRPPRARSRLAHRLCRFEQRPKPDHRRALAEFHGQKLEKQMGQPERAAADAWDRGTFRFPRSRWDTETSLDWLLDTLGPASAASIRTIVSLLGSVERA